MPERERAICARLRKFRQATGLSQAEFARLVGLDFNAYTSYEYARSQLNYPAAWRILNSFRLLNPQWLAEGEGIPFGVYFVEYVRPEDSSLGPRALFSLAYERFLKSRLAGLRPLWMMPEEGPLPYFPISPDIPGRIAAKDVLREIILDWLAAQPDSQVSGFVNDLLQSGVTLLKRYPPERGEAKIARFTELLRIEAKGRVIPLAFFGQNNLLTDVTVSDKHGAVKSPMANLLARLNEATRPRGMKSKLAKFMRVPLANVSQWLSGAREPGGETTLRLLHWVEQQERQPNVPGSATNTAKGKTQIRKSSYEKQSQARKGR